MDTDSLDARVRRLMKNLAEGNRLMDTDVVFGPVLVRFDPELRVPGLILRKCSDCQVWWWGGEQPCWICGVRVSTPAPHDRNL